MLSPRRLRASLEERRTRLRRLSGKPVQPVRRAVSPDPLDTERRFAPALEEPLT